MRQQKKCKAASFQEFIKEVEDRVLSDWPESMMKIFSKTGRMLAVCLTSPELSRHTRAEMVQSFNDCPELNLEVESLSSERILPEQADSIDDFGGSQHSLAEGVTQDPDALFMDHERFMIDLAVVTAESSKSRVPCAVLLIHADGDYVLVAKKIAQKFNSEYFIYLYSLLAKYRENSSNSSPMAVILPATGLNRARQLAEKIRKLGDSNLNLSIGVGASAFGSNLSQTDFLLQVEDSLDAASKEGNVVRWNVGGGHETCQVTAEERRQLFSW